MPKKTQLYTQDEVSELDIDFEGMKKWAGECIEKFFADKRFHCGGPIPQNLLVTPENVMTVMGTSSEACSQFEDKYIYPLLKIEKDQMHDQHTYSCRGVPFQVHYTLRLIQNLRDKDIPKRFQFGMILLYYKLCKGFKIPDPPEKIIL